MQDGVWNDLDTGLGSNRTEQLSAAQVEPEPPDRPFPLKRVLRASRWWRSLLA
jgi:hypothetical protein